MRYDKATGLFMPNLTPGERAELRTRLFHLVALSLAGKATADEAAEMARIDDTLYGRLSGYKLDKRRKADASALTAAMLDVLKRKGVLSSKEAVARGVGPEFVSRDDLD